MKSIFKLDTANAGTRSQKQATQAGSPTSSGARSSRDLPSLGQPNWDPGVSLQWNERTPPCRASVSRLASSRPGEVEASPQLVGGGPSDSFDFCVVPAPLRSSAFVNWTTVSTTAACDLRFERFGPAMGHVIDGTGARRTKFFTSLRDVMVPSRSRRGSFSGPRRCEEAARIPQLLATLSLQDLRWSEACRQRLARLLSARCGTVSAPPQQK